MLNGKTALVTGSTSGIGLGIATAFAREGANIVLNGFGAAADIETIRAGLAKDHGVTVTYSPADMTKADEIAAMVADAEKQFGAIDILVQQRRHPARGAGRRIPRSTNGTRSSPSTCRRRFTPSAPRCRR